jgi:2-polyprenyl-3-methyl-5-hydroxy-6-metoxy-1,4-benzoquinol methylase
MKCKLCGGKTKIWYKKLFDDRHGYSGKFNVEKCMNCGFAQTIPQLPKNKIKKLYKDYYPRQHVDVKSIKRSDYQNLNKFTLWRKGLLTNCEYWVKPDTDVLDVGSGLGYSLLYLEGVGCDVYGIDPDVHAVEVAKRFNLKFHLGFIEDNPFQGKKFDYIIGSQVLEHTNDPVKFLETCINRLKPNGKIILSFPNVDSLTRRILNEKWLHWHIPFHLNHFNRSSILGLSKQSKLKIQMLKTYTPNMWTNLQIRHLLIDHKEGTRDKFWDGEESINKTIKIGYLMKGYQLFEEYNPINRILDIVGFGESFVCIFESNH